MTLPLSFLLSSGLLAADGGLELGVSEWSALHTGTTAALGRQTAASGADNTGNCTPGKH